ncbi:hypothetical protein FALBO_12382 [Fusarium albosuccineum]|uniref:ABM domain-containing protein n=1 Tax=Fusarium albosuccineum TaxID=1237068 RepID=A0A8H4L0S3_9HYPO|nr:hypothetical protein FALBO_12382 [Fusarium albosuccineum]
MANGIPISEQVFLFGNWQAAYDKLAAYVMPNEPNTLTYYFGIPLEHQADHSRSDNMLAFESYRSKADIYDVHLKSEVMTKTFLRVAVPAMTTNLDLTHFAAVGGFLDFGGKKTECGLIHDVKIQCVDSSLEEKQKDGKGEVLTFLGLRALDNETGARIFARYQSREVWEAWLRSELIMEFWESVKPLVASMEARPYAPNGKGWLWK